MNLFIQAIPVLMDFCIWLCRAFAFVLMLATIGLIFVLDDVLHRRAGR